MRKGPWLASSAAKKYFLDTAPMPVTEPLHPSHGQPRKIERGPSQTHQAGGRTSRARLRKIARARPGHCEHTSMRHAENASRPWPRAAERRHGCGGVHPVEAWPCRREKPESATPAECENDDGAIAASARAVVGQRADQAVMVFCSWALCSTSIRQSSSSKRSCNCWRRLFSSLVRQVPSRQSPLSQRSLKLSALAVMVSRRG